MRTPDLEIAPGPCEAGGGAFGDAIASDGDRVIIGAPLHDGEGEPAACVGLLGDDGVAWEGALRPRPGDRFPEHYASAVALRGSIAVVGQLGGDSGDGPVHVFERRAARAWRGTARASSSESRARPGTKDGRGASRTSSARRDPRG